MHNLSLLVDIGLTDLPRSAGATDDTIILFMYLVTRDGGVGGGGYAPPPFQLLANLVTLFQPGGQIMPTTLLLPSGLKIGLKIGLE